MHVYNKYIIVALNTMVVYQIATQGMTNNARKAHSYINLYFDIILKKLGIVCATGSSELFP